MYAEITEGWNGKTLLKSGELADDGLARRFVSEAGRKLSRRYMDTWTVTELGPDKAVVDFGSHVYFARIVGSNLGVLDSGKRKQERKAKMATKKKPYSKVENGKLLRKEQFEYKALLKEAAKAGVDQDGWETRLIREAHELAERVIRLGDFLWVKETEDSPAFYSKEAEALGRKYCQLLVRQHKAMRGYLAVLNERIALICWDK